MTRIEIRNNATGEVRDCSNSAMLENIQEEYDMDIQKACDCTRAIIFDSGARNTRCGHGQFSVRLMSADGQRIYSDFAEDLL